MHSASQSTLSIVINLLIGFVVLTASCLTLLLVPTTTTAIMIGALVLVGGIALQKSGLAKWQLLAQISILVGAVILGGGIILADKGNLRSFAAIVIVYGIAGVYARSGTLIALAVFALGPTLGAASGYSHVTVQEPLLTVVVFSVLGMGLFWVSQSLAYSHLAIIASRTCALMVNIGFWMGAVWGDKLNEQSQHPIVISDVIFSVMWAVVLFGAAIWAWRENRPWLLDIVAVFGVIHFYTQWYVHFGATIETLSSALTTALLFPLLIRYIHRLIEQNKK
ncbi:MAG: hypothetical protein AB7I18_01975 [Candidatus Berkiella sp.]